MYMYLHLVQGEVVVQTYSGRDRLKKLWIFRYFALLEYMYTLIKPSLWVCVGVPAGISAVYNLCMGCSMLGFALCGSMSLPFPTHRGAFQDLTRECSSSPTPCTFLIWTLAYGGNLVNSHVTLSFWWRIANVCAINHRLVPNEGDDVPARDFHTAVALNDRIVVFGGRCKDVGMGYNFKF